VIEVAIVRPGPIQGDMVHPYLERRRNPERVDYPSDALKRVLERTLGVPIFQEQAMQIAMVAAGFSAGEADQLRRAMAAWKKRGGLEPFEARLKEGMHRNGYAPEFAERVYHQLRGFGEYGFPECVVGQTRIVDADTGRWPTIDDILSGSVRLRNTLACNGELQLQKRRVLAITPSGIKRVWRMQTALGHEITATAEHPFLTMAGWRKLRELRAGDYVAAARSLPVPGRRRWPRHRILVLADLIAEGNLCHPSTFYFYTSAAWHCSDFVKAVERFPNTRAVVERHKSCFSVCVRRVDRARPIGAVIWTRSLGIWGCSARSKYLPPEVFELCSSHIALLLARLWEGDGGFSPRGHASYDTASHRLGREVQHLLLRLDIVARLYRRTRIYKGRELKHYVVTITGEEPLRRFWQKVGCRFLDPDKRRQSKVLARRRKGRMSRDIVPVAVRALIRRERDAAGLTWHEIGQRTGLCMREIQAHSCKLKEGFRRYVIGRLAEVLQSRDLERLAQSDVYWDRIVAIEAIGSQPTYDLSIEHDRNFLADNLVAHNSHAASFALLTWVSSWLKCHEPAAFVCGLLNSQPMGFYAPSQLVQDAVRHGVEVRPVDVQCSDWDCTLEQPALRLGLRMVKGLAQEAANRIVQVRAEAPFASVQDLAERARLDRGALGALAAAGALQSLAGNRWQAHWQAAGVELTEGRRAEARPTEQYGAGTKQCGAGFSRPLQLRPGPEATPLLGRPTAMENAIADYNTLGLTLGPHPLALLRAEFDRLGVRRAEELREMEIAGRGLPTTVRVAGLVICRQRPDTASGVMFVTLEDETGPINLIVWPKVLEAQRQPLLHAQLALVSGTLQREEDVIHVIVARAQDCSHWLSGIDVISRNFAEGFRVSRSGG
jgi:DNA polymerase-3 subunit alpha